MNNLEILQKKINYIFRNVELLKTAMTHLSFANENKGIISYERLEFLGDAILEMVVSDYIYKDCPFEVGKLTKLRAGLVSTDYLCGVAEYFKLSECVLKSHSLNILSRKNQADLVESLIGAIYLDGGLINAGKFINKFILIDQNNIQKIMEICVDSKTQLQEYLQARSIAFEYRKLGSFGPDHAKEFEVELIVNGKSVSKSRGKSLRDAEEKCAREYLNKNNF